MTACVGRVGWARWANLFRPLTVLPTRARFYPPAVVETGWHRDIDDAYPHRFRRRLLRPALILVMGMLGSSCSPAPVSSPTASAQPTRELPAVVDVSRAGA